MLNQLLWINEQLKDFNLTASQEEEIFISLKVRIQWLLDHDFQLLINLLYRFDFSESKFKKIISTERPDNIASVMSKAIMERLKEKWIYRLKYS